MEAELAAQRAARDKEAASGGKPSRRARPPPSKPSGRNRNCATNWRSSSTRSWKPATAPEASSSTCPMFSSTRASSRSSQALVKSWPSSQVSSWRYPSLKLEVEGHTDNVGTDESNHATCPKTGPTRFAISWFTKALILPPLPLVDSAKASPWQPMIRRPAGSRIAEWSWSFRAM